MKFQLHRLLPQTLLSGRSVQRLLLWLTVAVIGSGMALAGQPLLAHSAALLAAATAPGANGAGTTPVTDRLGA